MLNCYNLCQKKKHHRWVVKLWIVCNAVTVTHYFSNFFVHQGAKEDDKIEMKENGVAYTVLIKLL